MLTGFVANVRELASEVKSAICRLIHTLIARYKICLNDSALDFCKKLILFRFRQQISRPDFLPFSLKIPHFEQKLYLFVNICDIMSAVFLLTGLFRERRQSPHSAYMKTDSTVSMKTRKTLSALLCIIFALGAAFPASYANARPGATENANRDSNEVTEIVRIPIRIDGTLINFENPARLLDSTTYVPLIEFSQTVIEENEEYVIIEQHETTVTVDIPGLHITAAENQIYLVANGRFLFTPPRLRAIDDEMFVPLRPLAKAFGLKVDWCADTNSVNLLPEGEFILCGSEFYDEDDLLWLARIIRIESCHEIFLGKIAVGNVIMNRVSSPQFRHVATVYEAIFDSRYARQFPPAFTPAMTSIEPCRECFIAAKLSLDGAVVIEGALYFNRRGLNSWASRYRPFLETIGNHSFFG